MAYGLLAALLFGASTPFAKRLLDDVSPQLLAGLLYLGAFAALAATIPFRRNSPEARLRRADAPRLAALTGAGGVLAPVLLLVGLERVSGTTASLLLNLEGPLTLLLGLVVFREHLGRRPAIGAAAVFGGALVLTIDPVGGSSDLFGAACIAAACALWAVDNNLTQSLTTRDPFAIVTVKVGVAAAVNLGIALLRGVELPSAALLGSALILGALSYGVSVVLDAYALRLLGAAREAAIFATAPFAGALLAVPVLSESFGARDLVAGAAMALGVGLMLGERHDHRHVHEPLEHDHVHVHDAHHRHDHPPGTEAEPHAHMHRHERLEHAHPHVSDVHHRHSHGQSG
jgi:drug/metabolite transporter (DMT)-like permease